MAVRFEMFHEKSVLKGQSERGMLEENEKNWHSRRHFKNHFYLSQCFISRKTKIRRDLSCDWRPLKEMWHNSTTVKDVFLFFSIHQFSKTTFCLSSILLQMSASTLSKLARQMVVHAQKVHLLLLNRRSRDAWPLMCFKLKCFFVKFNHTYFVCVFSMIIPLS